MSRDDAFDLALIAARTGVSMGPRLYQQMREALGQLTDEEEQMLRTHRLARDDHEWPRQAVLA